MLYTYVWCVWTLSEMGKRKKTDPHPNPPLKMVIARSPEKKKGPSNQQYAILDQKGL